MSSSDLPKLKNIAKKKLGTFLEIMYFIFWKCAQFLSALFIILVGLTMTWFGEKMPISHRCIRGLMPNLIKKSWTVSTVPLDCDLLLLCQHDHCESNAFIVVDHHDQWPWLESLLSTNMLFSVCFPWPYSIYTYIWHFPGS